MSMSDRSRRLAFDAVRVAAASVGLLTASGGEPSRFSGYVRQPLALDAEGASTQELKFGPFEIDAEDLTQYAIYDAQGYELGREALEPVGPQRKGIVLILPAGSVALRET